MEPESSLPCSQKPATLSFGWLRLLLKFHVPQVTICAQKLPFLTKRLRVSSEALPANCLRIALNEITKCPPPPTSSEIDKITEPFDATEVKQMRHFN
jgi:hypothetical protein